MPDRSFLRHVVMFSATNKEDIPRIIEGLSILADIPHSSLFEVTENASLDALSSEVDVIVYAEFKDRAALEQYKAHPLYQKSIDIVRPLRDMRVASDF
ncbi:Dabb family protein [Pseudoroseicyclus sp. H15]